MPEKPPRGPIERPPTPEVAHDALEELNDATAEEQRVLDEIKKVLEEATDKREAERIILERLAPAMDAALARSRRAIARLDSS